MKKTKNILVVSQSKIGLTETFISAHIERLKGNVTYMYGYNNCYFTSEDVALSKFYISKKSWSDFILSLLPHYIYFRIRRRKKKAFTDESLTKCYLKEQSIDIVLAEYGTTGSFITPICKALDIPLLVHFHGFDASRYDILTKFKDGYTAMFAYAQKIIVVSRAMKKALLEQGCPHDKLVLNTYGPHSDYFNNKTNFESDFIVSVGRHTYKKAPYLTILAFQKVLQHYPKLKLKIIGNGELFDVSYNLVKSLRLEDNILLLGGLQRDEIITHLSNAFLYIQHSLVAYNGDSEGTPVGIIEAMAAGLPVVSTRHAGIPDVVIEGETGFLVEEGDIDDMAEQIITLATNRDLAKMFGKRGISVIQEEFTLKKHLEIMQNLINEI